MDVIEFGLILLCNRSRYTYVWLPKVVWWG